MSPSIEPHSSASLSPDELAYRLEHEEVVLFPHCPFPLPPAEELTFLRTQTVAPSASSIGYAPSAQQLWGQQASDPEVVSRLQAQLANFSHHATAWLARQLPTYAQAWAPEQASFRPEEEATRSLPHHARNDLLHIDCLPHRPSQGCRLLRLFVNIHPSESRVWITSENFAQLLERFAQSTTIPHRHRSQWLQVASGLERLWRGERLARSAYDSLMLRLHHFLKSDDHFQEKAQRQLHRFPPGSAWLLFGDGLAHAVLRGQYALEHTFLVPPSGLCFPERSPLEQLAQFHPATRRVA